MTELICINCPKGCLLKVDEENGFAVTGNTCPRGEEYGKQELISPVRVVTTSVKITGGLHRRVPVKTNAPIPKGKIFEIMEEVSKVQVQSPVHVGDIVISNILDTGADLVICQDM